MLYDEGVDSLLCLNDTCNRVKRNHDYLPGCCMRVVCILYRVTVFADHGSGNIFYVHVMSDMLGAWAPIECVCTACGSLGPYFSYKPAGSCCSTEHVMVTPNLSVTSYRCLRCNRQQIAPSLCFMLLLLLTMPRLKHRHRADDAK